MNGKHLPSINIHLLVKPFCERVIKFIQLNFGFSGFLCGKSAMDCQTSIYFLHNHGRKFPPNTESKGGLITWLEVHASGFPPNGSLQFFQIQSGFQRSLRFSSLLPQSLCSWQTVILKTVFNWITEITRFQETRPQKKSFMFKQSFYWISIAWSLANSSVKTIHWLSMLKWRKNNEQE